MYDIKKLCVVGCGSVGEALLQLLFFKSLEFPIIYKEIEIIDPDIINSNNYQLDQYPKVYKIEDELTEVNPNIKLNSILGKFPDCFTHLTKLNKQTTVYIDCRDNIEQSSIFYMKIFSDGPYGHIIKYPKDNNKFQHTNYKIKNSKYYSNLTVSKVIEDISNIKELDYTSKEKKYIINHLIKTI